MILKEIPTVKLLEFKTRDTVEEIIDALSYDRWVFCF